jgi:hypothetical protein
MVRPLSVLKEQSSSSAVLSNWTQSGNLWVIGGQTQQGRVHPGAEYEPGTQRPGYPETVFLDNTPLKPVDALSKVVPGTFYFDYAADKIYIANNPTGHTIEAGKLTDAFHGSATNVIVQNLVIEKYDPQIQDGAIQGGRGWTIQNNEVRLNYAVGIIGVDGSKLIGNHVHDNGQMGLGSVTTSSFKATRLQRTATGPASMCFGRVADSNSPTRITWSCAATTQ